MRDLEEYIGKLKSQLAESETRCHQLDRDFIMFKEQQNSKPEVRLQSEINLLTLEKVRRHLGFLGQLTLLPLQKVTLHV